jgi:putative ABC transport system permease protein
MTKIIWHGVSRRWVQSVATLFAVAMSAAVLLAVYLLYQGVSLGLKTSEKRMGADLLVVPADAPIQPEQLLFTGAPVCVYMKKDVERELAKIPGVTHVTSQFFAQTLNAACCSTANATRLIGFDPHTDWLVQALAGDRPASNLKPGEILIGHEVQGFTGRHSFILGKPVHVAAVLEPTGTSIDQSIIMPIETARGMAKANAYFKHFWDQYGSPDGLISAILIETEKHARKDEIRRAIIQAGDYRVVQSADVFQGIKDQMNLLFFIIVGIAGLGALVSGSQLFARFFTLARDRKGEWGLYRALGATRRDLKLLVLGETLALTTGGLVLGLATGGGLYGYIVALLQGQKAFPFIAPHLLSILLALVSVAAFFALLGMVSAWIPAHQSGRISPSSAMALGDID